nr:hypothetical protein [Pontivivens ytuae]
MRIGACRAAGLAFQDLLDPLMHIQADQRLMMAATERYAPFGGLDITGIGGALEHLQDLGQSDLTGGLPLGECGLGFEETLHLGL